MRVLCCGISKLDIWYGLIKGEVLHCYIYNKKTRWFGCTSGGILFDTHGLT